MRAYVTGSSGFVGHWLVRHLEDAGDEVTALKAGAEITDTDAVAADLAVAAPEVVYHLAAFTNVAKSWELPAEALRVNAHGTLALLQAAGCLERPPRVVLVSSAEVYGTGEGRPLDEDAPLRPVSPYAASKVAAEFLGLQAFLGHGLEVIRVRPFNHVGPGQDESFVVSAFARRVVEAERSGATEIAVGNLEAARDFTDVRDVVRAYRLLAQMGVAGEVYNVCSGEAVGIDELLAELISLAGAKIVTVTDPELFRPVDLPLLVGDCSRIEALTGWRPALDRSTTLASVLDYWRERL